MTSFCVKEGIFVVLSSVAVIRLLSTPNDTPHPVPHNNLEFHIDCTGTAGGILKQSNMALWNIRILYNIDHK